MEWVLIPKQFFVKKLYPFELWLALSKPSPYFQKNTNYTTRATPSIILYFPHLYYSCFRKSAKSEFRQTD